MLGEKGKRKIYRWNKIEEIKKARKKKKLNVVVNPSLYSQKCNNTEISLFLYDDNYVVTYNSKFAAIALIAIASSVILAYSHK